MKKKKKDKKNKISRDKIYIIIKKLIPLVVIVLLALFYLIFGLVTNKITSDLEDAFSIDSIDYVNPNKFSDIDIYLTLTEYTYATEDDDGSIEYEIDFSNASGCEATDIDYTICAGDYWSNYVSDTDDGSEDDLEDDETDTGTFSIAYSNTNGWGFDVAVSDTPNIYLYLSYTFENEFSELSTCEYVLTYSFTDVFVGDRVLS